ncbi:alpha/beta hydrolase family protein [Promicromonospora sp. NPDC057138]|uniref:alpha/beta hydrolase family protein n=1 Tax=Promicromonospora sp. NPDC057138 TaxID=3346031 RepID=UPI0036396DC2
MTPVEMADGALRLLAGGRVREVHRAFAPAVRRKVSVRQLRSGWRQQVEAHGGMTGWRVVGTEVHDGADGPRTVVRFDCETPGPRLDATATVGADGELLGLLVVPAVPAWEPPSYADPELLVEEGVTLGEGEDAVDGTLTVPRMDVQGDGRTPGTGRRGPVPAVVLLSGMGPIDRDMTMGANKIGRDLAWGLAARGVATLRYDNPSHADPERTQRDGAVATDDYLPAVAHAVALLRRDSRLDPARIVLAGHSLGGKVTPRVALALPDDAGPSVAGLVLLAADASPMPDAAIRVTRYLAGIPGSGVRRLDAWRTARQAHRAADPRLSGDTPAARLPFGLPASFWRDMQAYDPVDAARSVGLPMLLLQGGRDYQVTVEDDLDRWRHGLADRDDVMIQVLPEDDHLFLPGAEPSSPAGYLPPQHLDERVIETIARWVHAQSAARAT